MKPLIFVLLLLACVRAGAQGRFVQSVYAKHSQCCSVIYITDQDYILFVYNDTSVELEMNVKHRGSVFNSYSFSHNFLGTGILKGDTLTIVYTSSSSTQQGNRQQKLRGIYVPTAKERVFYPPTVFVMKGDYIQDLNSDFPVLNKVSPAVAMNTPQPK